MANPNIFYLEDADYSGMMHAADLMISDVSSIFIEFLLLDKPVILFDNPRLKEFPLYRAEDIEYMDPGRGRVGELAGRAAPSRKKRNYRSHNDAPRSESVMPWHWITVVTA